MEEQERTEKTNGAEPELLYHYTTQKGLLGILHERCIWATHIRYLNDASEFKHGVEMVAQSVLKINIDPSTIQFKAIEANRPFPTPSFEGILQASANDVLRMLDFIDVYRCVVLWLRRHTKRSRRCSGPVEGLLGQRHGNKHRIRQNATFGPFSKDWKWP